MPNLWERKLNVIVSRQETRVPDCEDDGNDGDEEGDGDDNGIDGNGENGDDIDVV